MPCRIKKRRTWTARIVLESECHEENAFVTLTYSDDTRPGQLVPADLRGFLKRLRFYLAQQGRRFRYFAVGEYGERTDREHYHLMLFGCGLADEALISRAWSINGKPIGLIHVGTCTKDSAQYVAGYTTKKMTSADDPRLDGRHPEFARMSRRPGLGADAVAAMVETLLQKAPNSMEAQRGISQVVVDGKRLPCGPYLTRLSREVLGLPLGCSSEAWYEASKRFTDIVLADPEGLRKGYKRAILDAHEQAALNEEARYKIFAKKEVI